MAHEGGQGSGAGTGKHAQVVKPGTTSGEIGGIVNTNKQTPDAGDKPSRHDKASRPIPPGQPKADDR